MSGSIDTFLQSLVLILEEKQKLNKPLLPIIFNTDDQFMAEMAREFSDAGCGVVLISKSNSGVYNINISVLTEKGNNVLNNYNLESE